MLHKINKKSELAFEYQKTNFKNFHLVSLWGFQKTMKDLD